MSNFSEQHDFINFWKVGFDLSNIFDSISKNIKFKQKIQLS